jgi:hypothetical protein
MFHSLLRSTLAPVSSAVSGGSAAVPCEEIDALVTASTAALFLARIGEAEDGYTCLLAGRRRAEVLQREGHPWAPELVERYHRAEASYADRCGIALG